MHKSLSRSSKTASTNTTSDLEVAKIHDRVHSVIAHKANTILLKNTTHFSSVSIAAIQVLR